MTVKQKGERALDHHHRPISYGAFGMPTPQGWTVERLAHLTAGVVVLATQLIGKHRLTPPRALAAFVGANLVLEALIGWCPLTVALHRLGIPTTAERAQNKQV